MKTLVSLLIVLGSVSFVAAQIPGERKYDPSETVLHTLEDAVQAKYGNNYEVSFHIMDSLIANSYPDEITDPYGTLKGCVLFSAWHTWQSEDSIITGMYKNGRIIWDDYPGTKAGFASQLLTSKDINNDGEVDILEPELDQQRFTRESSIYYLWILSWNGTRGRLINDIDPISHQSTLVSTDGLYHVVDFNRNGIMVIRGWIDSLWQSDFPNLNPPTLPSITYSWNGSKYGYFPSTYQITDEDFYPANIMSISMHCNVIKDSGNFIYSYVVINRPSSRQYVDKIFVGGLKDTSSSFAPPGWRANSSRHVGGRFFYNKSYELSGAVSPGDSLSGFGTVSISPPTIVKYYVQGYRWFGTNATDAEYRNDILTNSVTGYTLGTRDTSVMIGGLQWVDTLISYKHQCVALGWLTNETVHEKDEDDDKADEGIVERLDRRLDKAKAALARKDSLKAKLELELFVKEVEQVYHQNKEEGKRNGVPVLTSEGYALLKYNAEYLIDRLPEGKHRHER